MLKRARDRAGALVGLDHRPRPASSRERIVKGLKQSAPFSSLQRLIIFFNLAGLGALVLGMTYLSGNRQNLLDVYVESLRQQGEIIAVGVAETAIEPRPGDLELDPERVQMLLARLARPTGTRIRLYDPDGHLIADTHAMAATRERIDVRPLPPPRRFGVPLRQRFQRLYDRVSGYFGQQGVTYSEVPVPGLAREAEVHQAAQGAIARNVRQNAEGELIISLAMPVQRLKAILGVLQLSTRSGEIERLLNEERSAIIEIFLLAAIVSVLLSIVLANMIARPIRRLAAAARIDEDDPARMMGPDRPRIPDLTHRTDEIGELSEALMGMTEALYTRIGAIESFASDVAHELKNPLTSLRSAVESMQYAKTDEQRQRLLDVIVNDAARMDRLITDISNASRLDAELSRERMETVDLGELIETLEGVFEAETAERHITIRAEIPEGGLEVRGLESRLAQVVINLIGNAISFSPDDGEITVTGQRLPGGGARVSVMDEGPGIPEENLDSIFERFYSERPPEESFGNHSGLGLSISRQIIETHGGRIWAENRVDAEGERIGARFVFDLPG